MSVKQAFDTAIYQDSEGKVQEAIGVAIVSGGGEVNQAIGDYETAADMLAAFNNFSGVAPGDFVTRKATSNGQVVTALSLSPLTEDTESAILIDAPVYSPSAVEIEASMSQRIRHDFATICLQAGDSHAVPDDINIVQIYQCSATDGAAYNATAGTVLTVVLGTAVPMSVYLSDWFHVYGLVDNRLNYPNLTIRWISLDRKTVVAGFSDEAALPSLAATYTPAAGTAKVKFYNNLAGATDGIGIRFTSTTVTSAALVSIFGGNDCQISGTLQGDHRVTIGTTAPIYVAGSGGNVEIRATSRYMLETSPRSIAWQDKAADSNVQWTARAIRTAVKPSINRALRPRFRGVCPKSMTRPVYRITGISKAGSTTWNITVTPNLTHPTGTYMTVKGVRDQANFANFGTPVAITVTGANTLTLTGTTGTATSYGGFLCLANGGVDQQGLLAQAVQTAAWDAATNTLTLVGSASWSTGVGVMNVGDYMHPFGVIDAAGNSLGVDGAWEVANISTTSLQLIPVYSVLGERVSPDMSETTLTTTPVNCGGGVLHRTTLRSHDITFESWGDTRIGIDGAGTGRLDKAVPTAVLNPVAIGALPALPAGTNLAADVGLQVRAGATGAATPSAIMSPATPAGASIKASGGKIIGGMLTNNTASARSVKFFNATAVTMGTTAAAFEIDLPPNATMPINLPLGAAFATGIMWAVTAAKGLTDNTATGLAANDVTGVILWA